MPLIAIPLLLRLLQCFIGSNCAKRSLRPSGSQNKMFRVSVRSFVRPSVRPFGVRIFGDFCEADMRGGHMPLNGEVLKHRFWNFLKKSGHCVNIIDKWKIFWTVFERFFWTFFSKMFRFKIFISGRLRARAVHGVSSKHPECNSPYLTLYKLWWNVSLDNLGHSL